jgi:hypothetical protein
MPSMDFHIVQQIYYRDAAKKKEDGKLGENQKWMLDI